MTVLKLVAPSDPILHQPTERIDFDHPQIDVDQLANDLADTLVSLGGVGLSANQVGIPYSMFVFGNSKNRSQIVPIVNPKIVTAVGEESEDEGCLTYPGLFLKVHRPFTLEIRYANMSGIYKTEKVDKLVARIFAHEIDHLNGVTFGQRVSKFMLRRALEKHNKKKNSVAFQLKDFIS